MKNRILIQDGMSKGFGERAREKRLFAAGLLGLLSGAAFVWAGLANAEVPAAATGLIMPWPVNPSH